MTRRIITAYERPPIPNADHWTAHDDNMGADTSPIGTGRTEAEAIEDLEWQLEELEA